MLRRLSTSLAVKYPSYFSQVTAFTHAGHGLRTAAQHADFPPDAHCAGAPSQDSFTHGRSPLNGYGNSLNFTGEFHRADGWQGGGGNAQGSYGGNYGVVSGNGNFDNNYNDLSWKPSGDAAGIGIGSERHQTASGWGTGAKPTSNNLYQNPISMKDTNQVGFQQNFNTSQNSIAGQGYQHQYNNNMAQSAYGERIWPNDYNVEKLPGVQRNPNGEYRPNMQQYSVMPQSRVNPPFPLLDLQDREGDEASESSSYKGTLEELDEFCEGREIADAVKVLSLLENNYVSVDFPRYVRLTKVCGEERCLEEAKSIHDHIARVVGGGEIRVNNRILDMYFKCGSVTDAYKLFEQMPCRNLASWDIMITGLANNGHGEEAIDLFSEFKKTGLKPDGGLFIAIFFSCGVLGAVDEGMLHFGSMQKEYGIIPRMDHYASIVKMLGTSGYVEEAFEFVERMPVEPNVDVWETLMNLCRINGDMELGDRCAKIIEHIDPSRMTEQTKMGLLPLKSSDLEREKKRKKISNLLQGRSRVHEYRAGDRSHPETDRIYERIRWMASQMKEAGYVPETKFVLHDIDQECKEEALLYHSERLATAYGVMTSAARSELRIMKNLRVCGDCHNAMKIISKLVGRKIVARDAKRFHHVENGVCSCNDYW